MNFRHLLLVSLVWLSACSLGPRVEFDDAQIFRSAPRLVRKGESYFLRMDRPAPDAARPLQVRCEVEGENLLVYVSILVSAERDLRAHPERATSRVLDYPLTLPSRLQGPGELAGRVYWLDPNGTKHALAIGSSAEAGILPASSRGRSR